MECEEAVGLVAVSLFLLSQPFLELPAICTMSCIYIAHVKHKVPVRILHGFE